MNDVYRTYFTKDPPARATVVAPLMGPQFQVEITHDRGERGRSRRSPRRPPTAPPASPTRS